MNVQPDPTVFDADDFVARQERKSLLRFIVCGSVDHGKSTLIGRMLYESGLVLVDQLDALDQDSRRYGTLGEERDHALLLDGLAAEREQKITIDVAYRFFTTARRKFIVADAPGHEQYTRNMATGASTADLALLLVSAADGLTRQTRRHALIVSTLGVRHFVVAVNKMDLVGWSELRLAALESEIRAFATELDIEGVVFIPVAARNGDNIAFRSQRMRWYRGPCLLEYLDNIDIAPRLTCSAFRMPVQWVNRPDPNFRGYCGLIASGEIFPGMPVQLLPSGQRTQIARIVTADGDLAHAVAGQAVTLTVAHEIDASRGDVVAEIGPPAPVTDRIGVRLVWIGPEPLEPGRPYLFKLASATVKATAEPALHVIDLETHRSASVEQLAANEIGTAIIKLDRLVAADRYVDNRETGSFILIDLESCDTVGMGIVEAIHPGEDRGLAPKKSTLLHLIRATESRSRSLAKAISWRATGSLDTFMVAVLITGSATLAGGVALAEVLTKTGLYYVHERIWALIPWGKR
jgi:sulfate adenylyltransferase large subunit